MNTGLQVLILEDRAEDEELLLHELKKSGIEFDWQRVETAADFVRCLDPAPDIILADYSMPQFDARRALEILRERDLDIPFIIVSGTIGEEIAVAAMKAGAHDFFTKGKLTRLVPAVERELREAAGRRARKQAEKALERYTRRLETLHAIDQAILTAESRESVARLALQYCLQQMSVPGASIVAFDFEAREGLVFAANSIDKVPFLAGARVSVEEWSADDIAMLRTGDIQVISRSEPPLSPGLQVLQKAGLQSYLRMPLIAHNELIGTLNLAADHGTVFTPEHREIAREIADEVAIALQQARFRERIQRHAAELEQRVIERTAELEWAKRRVETILNYSSDAVILAGSDGMTKQTNPGFNELFGYEADELLGLPLTALVEASSVDMLTRALEAVARGGERQRIEIMCCRKDGSLLTADMALAPLPERYSDQPNVICSVRDISERKEMEEGLRRALEKERELNELKSSFVSMVSHEFRTPLTAILSSSQLLKQYSDRLTDERKAAHLKTIETQVRRLTELLDDVLILGKAETVGLEFNPVPFDLGAFCRDLAEEIQVLTHTPHQIVFTASGKCGRFLGDEKLLRQIVTNLLTNAVKYSPEGGVIQFDLVCEGENALIRVKDEGLGIPEEDHKHLFDTFYRARNVHDIPGFGLGLPIVKRAVDAHGGAITVESQTGQGSTFTVRLPLA